ncbi:MAG: heme peroxidase [Cohaesibacter sp.]|nr:heme peroxidase [Cohaesibacter sp.]
MLVRLLIKFFQFILGKKRINRIAINFLANRGPNRPHAWSTLNDDYISWQGLTDRSYFSRLLSAGKFSQDDALGTARPPVDEVIKLFPAEPGKQVLSKKSTNLFPAFAQYLTDGFLRTMIFNAPADGEDASPKDDRKRTTSNHEIDLSTLYGRTARQTAVLRSMNGGKLKSQILHGEEFSPYLYDEAGKPHKEFCDDAGKLILDEPLGIKDISSGKPTLFAVGGDRVNAAVQVMAINTLFLREHNRLADLLAARYPDWEDERLFQIARNIVIFMFIRIVICEYINHISSVPINFLADPSVAWKANWNRPSWMTIEFTLLYRWHSLVTETITWKGQSIPSTDLLLNNKLLTDHGLVETFVQLSANPSAKMGLGNFAAFLQSIEQKGILQGRDNNVRGYNDYRKIMGLSRARSFEEVVGVSTADEPAEKARRKKLAENLKRLYGDVNNLEFYVGLFAEPSSNDGPIPQLALAMVAMDAFTQAFPNPLLSEHVWGNEENRIKAFSQIGQEQIEVTNSLEDILKRVSKGTNDQFVGMTQENWEPS